VPKIFPKNRKQFISAAVLVAVLIVVFNSPLFCSIKLLTSRIFSTPAVVCGSVGRYFVSKNALIRENAVLQKEVDDLSLNIEHLEDAEKENNRLRALLQFKKNFRFRTVSARVIARGPSDWTGSFVIDRGATDGVKPQAAICSAKGLLGKVVRVGEDRSFVVLLTHPSFRAGGVIKGSRVNGVIAGGGSGTVRMLYIPMDVKVSKGEFVTTSKLSRVFPRGIVVGKITNVKKSKTGLYQIAEIKPFAGFFDAEEVVCIVDSE